MPHVHADAMAALQRGGADRAILPIESTMEGTTLRNYDLLLRHDLARLGIDRETVEDTAGAVEMLDTTAIANPCATSLYGLDVLAHGLRDESWNVTRFLLQSRPPPPVVLPVDSNAKTSIAVAHPGWLHDGAPQGALCLLLPQHQPHKAGGHQQRGRCLHRRCRRSRRHPPVMILDTKALSPLVQTEASSILVAANRPPVATNRAPAAVGRALLATNRTLESTN
ncbi:hypothetical protein HU200_002440 [Digitaria exilis]|uniref:Prephenate dehydratase domain-containing protein n=1 Tax=Digitaria exilis TaxID=1010633 RepID=A0A835KWU7_9POAL|nr:hypothetical protein HU200_002440 [Digitaria exilis]